MLALLLAATLVAPVPFPISGSALLDTGWRFHAGDNPTWASPSFDDSRWRTIGVPASWRDEGISALDGMGWYRLRFSLAQSPGEPLAVRFESVADAYEVYLDGQRLGGVGGLPPHARGRPSVPLALLLPPSALAPGTHVLAVRVWAERDRGGIVGPVRGGGADDLTSIDTKADTYLLATALILFGLSFYQFFFWVRRPQSREHLYLFLFIVTLALFFLAWTPTARTVLAPWLHWYRLYVVFGALSTGFFCHAYRRMFSLDGDRVLASLGMYFHALVPFGILLPAWSHLRILVLVFLNPALIVTAVLLLVFAIGEVRRGMEHARILLWGVVPLALALLHDIVIDWGWIQKGSTFPWLIHLGALAFVLSVAYVTARRFVDNETVALYDRLTGLYRREMVLDALKREIRRAARTHQPLSVIMMDVDHFKAVNDQHGHQTGDRVLGEVGRRLAEAGRAVDWLGRYGGEEFLAVLADSDLAGADLAAERFRAAVGSLPIEAGRGSQVVTLSAGVAAYDGGPDWPTTEALVGAADAAMYRAKQAGRNRSAR